MLDENIPKDDYSLHDPNVNVGIIHKDGSTCYSESAWASFNKIPPLKDFDLTDLFSDNECDEEHTGKVTDKTEQHHKQSFNTENTMHATDKIPYDPPFVNTGKPNT